MSNINLVVLAGRVGQDPQTRDVGGDNQLVTTSMAVTQWGGSKKGETTMWVDLSFWGNKAKVTEYIRKGMKITVTGRLNIREHDGKKYTSINVTEVELPDRSDGEGNGGGGRTRGGSGAKSGRSRSRQAATEPDDDLPF